MNYLPLLPLFVVVYVVTADRNVSDYLYLKLFKVPALAIRISFFKLKLLIHLKYERFLLSRRIVPTRFYEMAKNIRGTDEQR
jgi:hypothetical protein